MILLVCAILFLGGFRYKPVDSRGFDDWTGNIVVKFKDSGMILAHALGWQNNLRMVDRLASANLAVYSLDTLGEFDQIKNQLENNPWIEYVEKEVWFYKAQAPNDPLYKKQLFHNYDGRSIGTNQFGKEIVGKEDADIDSEEAWKITTGSKSTIVAIIDDGCDYKHPDLIDNSWDSSNALDPDGKSLDCPNPGWDFGDDDNDPSPSPAQKKPKETGQMSHGTAVAGVIGAKGNNEIGISGVCWDVSMMYIKIYPDDALDEGVESTSSTRLCKAIDFATQNKAKIINMSLLTYTDLKCIREAIARFLKTGGILVAAAGNGERQDGIGEDVDKAEVYPACYDYTGIIAVAATDLQDNLAEFSNFGLRSIDVAAPGTYVYSTGEGMQFNDPYRYCNGTSFATPQVAGLAALIWSYKPELTSKEVKSLILDFGDSLPALDQKTVSGKRINAFNSLDQLAPKPELLGKSCYGGAVIWHYSFLEQEYYQTRDLVAIKNFSWPEGKVLSDFQRPTKEEIIDFLDDCCSQNLEFDQCLDCP